MFKASESARILVLHRYWLTILICAIGAIASSAPGIRPATAGELAPGLRGEYFDNEDFTDLKLIRTDPTVDYNLRFDSPDPSINPDRFSIRWTGQITATTTGNYVFVTHSDDGTRLWINDQLVIDNFVSHPETEDRSALIPLVGGQSYHLRLEYFELTANAVIRLLWIRPGQTQPEVIPQSQLSTPLNPNPAPAIAGISPNILPVNAPAFTIVVTGNNFLPGAVVQWNNATRPTMFVSGTQLNASIPAGDLNIAGLVSITAVNPSPGGGTSNPLIFTVSGGYEADVAPRPNGNNNGRVTIADWTQVGRFNAGLDIVNLGSEFQRADCSPRGTLGDGRITLEDWVQAGRYASSLDPIVNAGGPGAPNSTALSEPTDKSAVGQPRIIRLITQPGGRVLIECSSPGGENAFGFSLSFDATKWQFVSATRGADAGNAHLFVNSALVSRIGIALALPPGRKLKTGSSQIVVLTFRPRSGNIVTSASPPATFIDHPVMRQAVDVAANRLKVIYRHNDSAFSKPALARAMINQD